MFGALWIALYEETKLESEKTRRRGQCYIHERSLAKGEATLARIRWLPAVASCVSQPMLERPPCCLRRPPANLRVPALRLPCAWSGSWCLRVALCYLR